MKHGDSATGSPPEMLNAVARQVGPGVEEAVAECTARLPGDLAYIPPDEVAQHLLWILRACLSDSVAEKDQLGATSVLRRRFIDVLRTELIASWAAQPPVPDVMVETLQRLERAQRAAAPEQHQSFAAELADRGGLDLVVEVAHDMRSPLTSVLFLSEILHRGQSGPLNDVQKRQIGIVYSAALGLVGLASDMIEMARGGSRLAAVEAVPFSVNGVLRSVGDLVRVTAEEKGLELRIDELASETRIGYPIPLSRVLLNLTTNALKFTHEGVVHLSAESISHEHVVFSVRDTGPGIPPHAMETLYEPFRREPRRERGYYFSGTGLGLAMCRRLVAAMDSRLEVDTSADWGTRFSFDLLLPPADLL